MGGAQSLPKSTEEKIIKEKLIDKARIKQMKLDLFKKSPPKFPQDCPKLKAKRDIKILRYKPLDSSKNKSSQQKEYNETIKIKLIKKSLTKVYLLEKLRASINLRKELAIGSTLKQIIHSSQVESNITKPLNTNKEVQNSFNSNKEIHFETLKLDEDSDNCLEELVDKLNIEYKFPSINKNESKVEPIMTPKLVSEVSTTPSAFSSKDNTVRAKYSKVHVFNYTDIEFTPCSDQRVICVENKRYYGQLPRKDLNFASVSSAVIQNTKLKKQSSLRSSFLGKQKLSLMKSSAFSVVGTPRSGFYSNLITPKSNKDTVTPRINTTKLVKYLKNNTIRTTPSEPFSAKSGSNSKDWNNTLTGWNLNPISTKKTQLCKT